jgi:hypothetical protein
VTVLYATYGQMSDQEVPGSDSSRLSNLLLGVHQPVLSVKPNSLKGIYQNNNLEKSNINQQSNTAQSNNQQPLDLQTLHSKVFYNKKL